VSDEKPQPIKVWLVNPPVPEPWRTREEYNDDQKRSRRLYWTAFASIIISALGVVATAVSATTALRSQTAQAVRVECVAPVSSSQPPPKVGQ